MLKSVRSASKVMLCVVLAAVGAVCALAQSPGWQSAMFAAQKGSVLRTTVEWSRIVRAEGAAPRLVPQPPATGTAFAISKDGDALTAAHVIAGWNHEHQRPYSMDEVKVTKVTVHRESGAMLVAQPVPAGDALHMRDVAILKIDGGGPWTPVCFAQADSPSPATELLAIGYEGGHSSPSHAWGTLRNQTGIDGNYETSLNITRGFSGGPVFNQTGQVVGMARAGLPSGPVTLMVAEREFRDARKNRTNGACGVLRTALEWASEQSLLELVLGGGAGLLGLAASVVVFLRSVDKSGRPLACYRGRRKEIGARRAEMGYIVSGLCEAGNLVWLIFHSALFAIGFCIVVPSVAAVGLAGLAVAAAGIFVVVGFAIYVIFNVAAAVFGGSKDSPTGPPPAPPSVAKPKAEPKRFAEDIAKSPPVKVDGTWIAYPVVGQDAQKLYADFVFYAMDTAFYWQLMSVDLLRQGDKDVTLHEVANFLKQSLGKTISTEKAQVSLGQAQDLVIIGTSSQTGDRAREAGRALQRANNVARAVALAQFFKGGIFTLNLGQARTRALSGSESDARQRPLIVVFVMDKDPGVNLGQAIANAMNKRTDLPHQEDYWEFLFQKFN